MSLIFNDSLHQSVMELIDKVISSAILLVFNKCRDAATEKLKKGGLTKRTIGKVVEREIHEIKSTLQGIASNDLMSSIDAFEVGFKFLCEALEAKRDGDKQKESSPATETDDAESADSVDVGSLKLLANGAYSSDAVSLAESIKNIRLSEVDGRAKRALSNAKDCFKTAREEARKASTNQALDDKDCLKAFRYRVMATLFEAVLKDSGEPTDALPECNHCLGKLHWLPAVRSSFKDEITGKLLNVLHEEARRDIISTVCLINRVIYDVKHLTGEDVFLWSWPFVDIGEDKIDPLRDARVSKVLHKQGMEHFCVTPRSFGQEGEDEHKLKAPWRIASAKNGNFILADNRDRDVKVFDDRGQFLFSFRHPSDDGVTEVKIYDVATDKEGNIYALFERNQPGESKYGVCMKTVDGRCEEIPLREQFSPGRWDLPCLAVTNSNQVLVLGKLLQQEKQEVIDVYNTKLTEHGEVLYVRTIGAGKLKKPTAITVANNGRVLVQDEFNDSRYIRVFNEEGEQEFKFKVEGTFAFADIAFNHTNQEVIVACQEAGQSCLHLLIFTDDGLKIVRRIQIEVEGLDRLRGITMANTGHLGFLVGFLKKESNNPANNSFITPAGAFIETELDYKVLVI